MNPTRMERTRQRSREKVALRGYKLLKDKSDEMLQNFLHLIKQNRTLRNSVETDITHALQQFMTARINMGEQEIENAVSSVHQSFRFTAATQNIMGLVVPRITLDIESFNHAAPAPTYLTTHPSFDRALANLHSLLIQLAELANVEKAATMLACEIERNRRRINALDHVVIPQIDETIKYITMKLSEYERGNLVRLMKVKEMLEQQEESGESETTEKANSL